MRAICQTHEADCSSTVRGQSKDPKEGGDITNQAVWFDILVTDLDRAIRFYREILGAKVKKEEFPGGAIGVLPHEDEDQAAIEELGDRDLGKPHIKQRWQASSAEAVRCDESCTDYRRCSSLE